MYSNHSIHFIHDIAIYPDDKVICSFNNYWGQALSSSVDGEAPEDESKEICL